MIANENMKAAGEKPFTNVNALLRLFIGTSLVSGGKSAFSRPL